MRDNKVHHMRLAAQPFALIDSGAKTVEVRLYDEKRRQIEVGDKIIFTLLGSGRRVNVKVVALHMFKSFLCLFSSPLISKTGSGGMTAAEAAESMYKYYLPADESKYGVLGIEIEKISESD